MAKKTEGDKKSPSGRRKGAKSPPPGDEAKAAAPTGSGDRAAMPDRLDMGRPLSRAGRAR